MSATESTLSDLSGAFAEARVTLVVGTGLSMSASGGAPGANWTGFLRESIQWATENISAAEDWAPTVEAVLETALKTSDTSMLISAASMVANKIEEQGEQAKLNWLRQTVGALPLISTDLSKALGRLKCPILTTNYDTLIEQATGRASAAWTSSSDLQKVMSRISNAVGHLHGVWEQVDSVVLSEADYARVLQSAPLQALQQAASSVTSLVYIGVGDGLDDPNFSRLLSWHRSTFPTSVVPHFRLCRDSELASLTQTHGSDNIRPVSYGASWEDLPAFLEQFFPSDAAVSIRQNHVQLVRDALTARVRDLSIVCEKLGDLEDRTLGQLIAAPVLLPLSTEQFRASQSSVPAADQLKRCDPHEVAAEGGVTVVAGPDGSGRTTALYWLLEESSKTTLGSAPVMVEYSELNRGGKPLSNALRNRVRESGVPMAKGAALPRLVVGIDDMSPFAVRIAQQTVEELVVLVGSGSPVFMTCKEGFEGDLAKLLSDAGLHPTIRYVGELSRSDIRDLVKLAEPSRSKVIEDNVVSILKQQHLPRTPFTVSLLISVLNAGHVVAANSSHTTLLDLYLNQLIGRGDIAEDSRWGMDSDLRSAVLSDLAEFYIRSQAGSLPEAEVVNRIGAYFHDRGIPESAADLLLSLRKRKVLSHESGRIYFSHSSYLFVFAAKTATRSRAFRDYLLSDPLLFAPVLRHYPSLERSDSEFLSALADFFRTLDSNIGNSASIHEPIRKVHAPDDLEHRLGQLESSIEQPETPGPSSPGEPTADDLEAFPRQHNEGSPLALPEELPDFFRLSTALDLVSTALRDSLLIADPELKKTLLKDVLRGWGKLGSLFNDDPDMVEAASRTIEEASRMLSLTDQQRETFVAALTSFSPVIVISSGIASSLSTTRLLAALEDALMDPEVAHNADSALGVAVFLLDVQPNGWVKLLDDVSSLHKDTKVVAHSVKLLCVAAHAANNVTPDERSRLRRYISDLEARRMTFENDRDRQRYRALFEQKVLSQQVPLKEL